MYILHFSHLKFFLKCTYYISHFKYEIDLTEISRLLENRLIFKCHARILRYFFIIINFDEKEKFQK